MIILKKNNLIILRLLLIIFVIFNVFLSLSVASSPSYELDLAQFHPTEDYANYRTAERFIKRVYELSDGRITINHFPGDLMGGWESQQIQVKQGSLDITVAPPSASFDPELEFTRLPYIVFDWKSAKEVHGFGGSTEQLLQDICERNNTHYLGNSPGGFLVLISSKEFTPLPGHPSLKNIKCRVMASKIEEMIAKSFGFTTLSMPFGEIYSSLMLGIIDAATGPDFDEAALFKDVIKFVYNYRYGFGAIPWIINLEVWNNMSEEDQNIIQTAMKESLEIYWDEGIEIEEKNIALLEEAGVEVIDLTNDQIRENIKVAREEVWNWAADNFLNEELVNKVRSFCAPIPN